MSAAEPGGVPVDPPIPECDSCNGEWHDSVCTASQRLCGHHCNHVDDGSCHWCGLDFEGES